MRVAMKAVVQGVALVGVVALANACSSSSSSSSRDRSNRSADARPVAATQPMPATAPATRQAGGDPRLEELVAKLDDSRLRFSFKWWADGKSPQWVDVDVSTGIRRAALLFEREEVFDVDELRRRLVRAMDDPAKTAAAHCELYLRGIYCEMSGDEPPAVPGVPDWIEATTPPKEPFLYNVGGLVVELTPVWPGVKSDGGTGPDYEIHRCKARIDPGQLPALRAKWRARVAAREYEWPR